jgi:hypothetical protein
VFDDRFEGGIVLPHDLIEARDLNAGFLELLIRF